MFHHEVTEDTKDEAKKDELRCARSAKLLFKSLRALRAFVVQSFRARPIIGQKMEAS